MLTAIDVFSKDLFAVPLTTISAPSVAAALASIMFNHSYIPKEIKSDLGTQFVSELFSEVTLGCGRDKLLWQQVRNLLIEVFQHTNLTITVCVLPHRAPYDGPTFPYQTPVD